MKMTGGPARKGRRTRRYRFSIENFRSFRCYGCDIEETVCSDVMDAILRQEQEQDWRLD